MSYKKKKTELFLGKNGQVSTLLLVRLADKQGKTNGSDGRTVASDIVECVITLIKTHQSAPCIAAAFVVIVDAS